MATKIYSYTSKGKRVNATRRAGVPTSPLGRYDAATGVVWQRPRKKQNEIQGSSVRVTNPKATTQLGLNGMTGSLGMGGVGQRGRNRDVGTTKAKGEV